MLGKLIKYEFKASSRLFLLLYAALIAMSVINLLLEPLRGMQESTSSAVGILLNIVVALFMVSYVILILAVVFVTVVVIIMRFYRNLLGEEGYLMFTLPVKTDAQISSKLIVSTIWSILSACAVIASLMIVLVRTGWMEEVQKILDSLNTMGINIAPWIIGMIITILISVICQILMFYGAMAVGANLTKNRLLGSFLGYVILYAISQVVALVSIIIPLQTHMFENIETAGKNTLQAYDAVNLSNTIGLQIFLYVTILNLILAAGYYFVTRYFIKNKLNLT